MARRRWAPRGRTGRPRARVPALEREDRGLASHALRRQSPGARPGPTRAPRPVARRLARRRGAKTEHAEGAFARKKPPTSARHRAHLARPSSRRFVRPCAGRTEQHEGFFIRRRTWFPPSSSLLRGDRPHSARARMFAAARLVSRRFVRLASRPPSPFPGARLDRAVRSIHRSAVVHASADATASSADAAASGAMKLESSNKVFGGEVRKYTHASTATGTDMTFSSTPPRGRLRGPGNYLGLSARTTTRCRRAAFSRRARRRA